MVSEAMGGGMQAQGGGRGRNRGPPKAPEVLLPNTAGAAWGKSAEVHTLPNSHTCIDWCSNLAVMCGNAIEEGEITIGSIDIMHYIKKWLQVIK